MLARLAEKGDHGMSDNGYVYFKCSDGEVYRAKMDIPDPHKPFSMPRLVPEQEEA